MLIALCSAKGAPGVTTSGLALALSWPRRVLLAELDPAGGDVLAGYGRGELSARGLAELEAAARHGGLARQLAAHSLRLDAAGHARLLPGLADPAGARHVGWQRLAAELASLGDEAVDGAVDGAVDRAVDDVVDVVADCGRLRTEHFPAAVLDRAHAVVLVTGSTLRGVRAATHAAAELRQALAGEVGGAGRLAVLVVGPGEPYGEREIGEALAVPVVASLPRDARAAAVFSDGAPAGRLFTQSPLMRAARTAAAGLAEFAAGHADRLAPAPAPLPSPATLPSSASMPAPGATVGGGRGR